MSSLIVIDNEQLMFHGMNGFMLIDKNNNPSFKEKDICDILEYTNSRKAIQDNVREKYCKMYEDLKSNS